MLGNISSNAQNAGLSVAIQSTDLVTWTVIGGASPTSDIPAIREYDDPWEYDQSTDDDFLEYTDTLRGIAYNNYVCTLTVNSMMTNPGDPAGAPSLGRLGRHWYPGPLETIISDGTVTPQTSPTTITNPVTPTVSATPSQTSVALAISTPRRSSTRPIC